MSKPILRVFNLHAGYDGVPVVFGVSLEIMPGELAAIVGANGAGKTTTMRAIVGLNQPMRGKVTFEGRDISRMRAHETLALGKPGRLAVELTGLQPGAAILLETLDKRNGNALAAWEALGQPGNVSREQASRLRDCAAATKRELFTANAEGIFRLQREIEPWSVILVREL
jgi:ABC-type transport system involved in cytochrome c biogenesis ATPase subunit